MSFKVVLQGSIIILLFAYVALGPYSAYYHQAIDQARAPVEIAYRAVSNAVYDVYLLATNPTEWYARQQVINVRPERPLDFPKGLEVVLFDARPASVSGGAPFAVDLVVKNDGFLDARHVTVAYSCNQWCSVEYARVENSLDPSTIPGAVDSLKKYRLYSAVDAKKAFYVEDNFQRGGSGRVTISDFVSKFYTQRAAETNFARVFINISYATSTNTSLKVTVISDEELEERFLRGDTVFKPVTAISKPTPGQISLNVGPQPLKSGTAAQLLVSVFNTRDFSKVVLYRDSEIIIRLPNVVGNNLTCDGQTDANDGYENKEAGVEVLHYKIRPAAAANDFIEILPYEFRSIYAFVCRFTAAKIDNPPGENRIPEQAGLITAELPDYIFRNEQKKDIPLTPPLGIIFDPFEATCNQCGDGTTTWEALTTTCTQQACSSLSQGEKKCWYGGQAADLEYFKSIPGFFESLGEGATNTLSRIGKNVCHSCRLPETRDCSMFTGPTACQSEDSECGLNCIWNPNAVNQLGIPVQRCEDLSAIGGVAGTGPAMDRTMQMASAYKASLPSDVDQQVKTEGIANSFEEMILKLAWHESNFRHCKDGTLNCISDTTYNSLVCSTSSPSDEISSCGVMQIAINKHENEPGGNWRTGTTDHGCGGKGAYDVDCNIRLGIGLLTQYYNQYGTNGNPNPACKDEPYRTKYISYRGWKAALRAYNGWGCPKDYPGGQAAAGNFVENVISTDASKLVASVSNLGSISTQPFFGYKINGQTPDPSNGYARIGNVDEKEFYAKITKVEGNQITIEVALNIGGTYDYLDCNSWSGIAATLSPGDDTECESSTYSTIFSSSSYWTIFGDDVAVKLVSVDTTNKNIQLSIAANSFWGTRYPLPDWQVCVNGNCAKAGDLGEAERPQFKVRIAVSNVDTQNKRATITTFTKTGILFSSWQDADCSNWPLGDTVTLGLGEQAGCQSSRSLQFTEDFNVRLDLVDSTSKKIMITVF